MVDVTWICDPLFAAMISHIFIAEPVPPSCWSTVVPGFPWERPVQYCRCQVLCSQRMERFYEGVWLEAVHGDMLLVVTGLEG